MGSSLEGHPRSDYYSSPTLTGRNARSPWSLISPTSAAANPEGSYPYETSDQLVFVYGTLKRGLKNHKLMIPKAGSDDVAFISAARTEIPYPMIYDTNYFIPYVLEIPGGGLRVEGEIYRVSPSKMRELDILEGCPRRYERGSIISL
mmetsp:Transcript_19404/g.19142  ORF Transcript_19404/g.19142 Transcript_19404/m.19142 type:complete len:147 (-) Transcript_19404:7-447(-)